MTHDEEIQAAYKKLGLDQNAFREAIEAAAKQSHLEYRMRTPEILHPKVDLIVARLADTGPFRRLVQSTSLTLGNLASDPARESPFGHRMREMIRNQYDTFGNKEPTELSYTEIRILFKGPRAADRIGVQSILELLVIRQAAKSTKGFANLRAPHLQTWENMSDAEKIRTLARVEALSNKPAFMNDVIALLGQHETAAASPHNVDRMPQRPPRKLNEP